MALAARGVAAHQGHGLGPGQCLGVALAPLDTAVVAAAQSRLALFGDGAVGFTGGVTAGLDLVHPSPRVGRRVARIPRTFLVSACFLAVAGELLGRFTLATASFKHQLALLGVGGTVAVLPRLLFVATLFNIGIIAGASHLGVSDRAIPCSIAIKSVHPPS